MSERVDEYEDLLDGTEHRWRNRLIGLAAIGALAAAGAFGVWTVVLGGGSDSTEGVQTATVERYRSPS